MTSSFLKHSSVQSLSMLQSEGIRLVTGMTAAGFGLPAISSQFSARVVAKAMHGCELLASQVDGFAEVSSGLNHAHYIGWLHCSLRRVSFPHASQHHPGTESTDDQSAPCTASQFSPNKGSSPNSPTLTCNLVAACSSAHAVPKPGACSEIWEFAGAADFDDLTKQQKSKLLQAYHNMPQLLRHAPH